MHHLITKSMVDFRFYGHTGNKPGWLFSNFSPHPTLIDGHLWMTTEHYFQAMKFLGSDDAWFAAIRDAKVPADTKKMGNSREHKIRPDWEEKKDDVMRVAVKAKVAQHKDVRDALVLTGTATIIESAPNDYYWGEGVMKTGKNMLGVILMEVRDQQSSS